MHKVFVYGTLRKNERNSRLLENAKCLAYQAWINGVLYDTGNNYPAVVLDDNHRVYGELYELTDIQLSMLDELEGYFGEGCHNHYDRVVQTVYTDFGQVEAYVYVYSDNLVKNLKVIEFGDWKCHLYLDQEELYYFAYGSCMDDERFERAGVAEQFNYIGRGEIAGYSLSFTHKLFDGGRADMVESNDWVEGKVYKINQETLEYLFEREGVWSKSYRPAFINVNVDGEVLENVLTFFVVDKEKEEIAPPEHYAIEILRGAKGCVSDKYFMKLQHELDKKFGMSVVYN